MYRADGGLKFLPPFFFVRKNLKSEAGDIYFVHHLAKEKTPSYSGAFHLIVHKKLN